MNRLSLRLKSDVIGAFAGALCLVHCLASPLLFMAQAGLVESGELHPSWWGLLDIAFLCISFLAVWWSAQNTSKNWMSTALWSSWGFLAVVVLNEKIPLFPLAEQAIYIPTIALVLLHLYNRKYCSCNKEHCCLDK